MPPTAPTVVTGNRYTTVGISQNRRIVEMMDAIAQYDASATPTLAVLSKRAPQAVSGSPKFQHLEDQPLPNTTTFSTGYNATATSIVVATGAGAYFRAGDVLQFSTAATFSQPGELVYVSSVSTDTLTVIRNWDGDQTNGGAVSSGDTLQIIGNTNAEFATARAIKTTTEATVTNYLQIIRTPYAVSNTLEGSNLYGGNDLTYQRQKMATQHALEIERTVLFGKPAEKSTSTTPTRTTGGFLNWVTSNVVNANGSLTWATVETLFEKTFRYGSKNKMFMVSRKIASQLDLISEGRLVTSPGDTMYGVAVQRLNTTHGTLVTVVNDQLNASNGYSGYGLLVDLENVRLRYLTDKSGNRLGQLHTNIQANDADGIEEEYRSEIGLQVMLESAHGYISGVT